MKKIIALLMCFSLTVCLMACEEKKENTEGLTIVATLFPQYDFAREIVGELGEVTLLLDPGMESHSFDPSTADMVTINQADIFLYTGPALETWVAQMTDSFQKDLQVVDLSEGILEELERKGNGEESSKEHQQVHHHAVDPHIWTSPEYAMKMVETICQAVCKADPAHKEIYEANAKAYREKLEELDQTFEKIVNSGVRKEIVHGGRFALYHFAKRYGLEWEAAYDSCTAQTEPSAKKIAQLTAEIREKKIPVIFYEELMEPKVAKSISEATGVEMLLLHSCHNVSAQDFERGVTYLQLMEENAKNLRVALN